MPSLRALSLLLLLTPALLPAQTISYARQVQPVLAHYCNGCHSGWVPKGGLFTGSVAALKKGGKSGAAVVEGEPGKSLLVQRLAAAGDKQMPPADKRQPLPEEIDLLRAWVASGARDDSGTRTTLPALSPAGKVEPAVAALAYSPDGKLLVAGAGGTLTLIDPATGTVRGRLPVGGDGKITAVAFRPDGKLLAVATGRPSVLGEVTFCSVADGTVAAKPVRQVTAHLDLVQALAFSPDGKTLATASYDRLVRLWSVETGLRLRDLRDHSDSVYGVGFSHDGKLLATAGADRAVKVWDVATGKRLFTLGEATDWVYAVAWHPTRPVLAAAGVDRNIRVWDITAAEGKLTAAAFAHEEPVVRLAFGPRGEALYSLGEDRVAKAWDAGKLGERRVFERQADALHALAVSLDGKQVAVGRHDGLVVLFEEATGKPQANVAAGPVVKEENAGNAPATAQAVALTATIEGAVHPAGDVDFYRFDAKPGQEVGVQVTLPAGSKLEPVLELVDPRGRVVATSTDKLLAHVCTEVGSYALSVRDREYRGEPAYTYTLKVGAVPVATGVFPMGVQRGKTAEVVVAGANLGDGRKVTVNVPADAVPGSKIDVPLTTPLGPALGSPQVVVGEFAEETKVGATLAVPGTGNGHIEKAGQLDAWKFAAKKGERLVVEVLAARAGSPLDSTIEIRDAAGRPVPVATLRGVAKIYTTFRDHDSVGPGIRLESWNEMAVDDYVLVGTELTRIEALPANPDADCRFYSEQGRRLAFLGTSPTHHPQGEPMYKVEIHPPGRTFPPNGLPVVTLFARNDDGGTGYGKDSRLFFDPPADGVYSVHVGDSRGQAGPEYTYRVTVRPPRPDFTVKFAPTTPAVSKGSAVPVEITAERRDAFDGPIAIEFSGLPPGLTAPKTEILAGRNSTAVALLAAKDAVVPAGTMFSVKATAVLDGKPVEKVVGGGKPTVIEPGDITTTTEQSAITIRPGGQTRLTVAIERKAGFTGRVPVEVRGLPHGVRVLDVGLNGILITPRETKRTIVLEAEPWVEPTHHPIVVLAKREGKNTEHAAPSVLLRVEKGKGP